jgi:thiamine transporter ThiT
MSEAVHDFHPGDQDIHAQVATYRLFGRLIKWGSLTIATLLVMLVLWFCVGAGFLTGLFAGLVLLAVGIYFLRSRPEAVHSPAS